MPAAGFTANAIPRGQCQLLHVTCRVEAMEGKAPYSSEYTADAVRDSRQGVVLQLGRKTDSSSLCNSCKLQNVARGFKINKRRVFVKAVMNIQIPKKNVGEFIVLKPLVARCRMLQNHSNTGVSSSSPVSGIFSGFSSVAFAKT